MLDNVGPCGQESAAHVPTTPTTPVTPVTTDGVKSLHSMIRHYAGAWNDQQSSSRLQRCVQKLASATQISLAKQTLLQEQNQYLSKANAESQVRRSTRSIVLGKGNGNVMSKEDLDQVRAERAEKERITATKATGKRGHKRKLPAVDAATERIAATVTEQVTDTETEAVTETVPEAVIDLQAREDGEVNDPTPMDRMPWLFQLEPGPSWVAPVARMY
jgi:hypothetical protein